MRGSMKGLLLLAVLAALGAGWMLRGDWLPPALRGAAEQARQATTAATATGAATGAAARKCVGANGELLYSTEPCPAGTREQALKGGTLTVLAAPPAPPASKASAQSLLQRLDDQAETERMRERRMQKALGE